MAETERGVAELSVDLGEFNARLGEVTGFMGRCADDGGSCQCLTNP